MPDTGAPWNIPYVEAADLVSDWPADSLALANAIDAGLDAAGNAGIGSNVVQTTKTTAFTTTSSAADVTDFDVVITPTSATSKVLIVASFVAGNTSGEAYQTYLYRDSTQIAVGGSGPTVGVFGGANASWADTTSILCLDSPATTSATTYKVQLGRTAGTAVFNRRGDTTDAYFASLVAIEVAA